MQFPDINRVIASRSLPGLPALPKAPRNMGQTATNFANKTPIEVAGTPSVKIKPLVGTDIMSGVMIEVTLRTQYGANLDKEFPALELVASQMLARYESMSRGPLSSKMLAKIGHPYGRDKGVARRVPRGAFGHSVGHAKGVRGSVPTLTVINRQSGNLASSWGKEVVSTPNGAVIRFTNDAPPSFLLAAGTRKMQAHSPASYVPSAFRSQIMSAWQKEVSRARSAFIMESQAAQSLGI